MSNFYCEHCGAICSEDERGYYVTGCEHYPVEKIKWHTGGYEMFQEWLTKHKPQAKVNIMDSNQKQDIQEINIGEVWYIRHIGAGALCKVKVTDITKKTVEVVKDYKPNPWYFQAPERYEHGGIEFIEKVEE